MSEDRWNPVFEVSRGGLRACGWNQADVLHRTWSAGILIAICILSALAGACGITLCILFLRSKKKERQRSRKGWTTKMILDDAMKMVRFYFPWFWFWFKQDTKNSLSFIYCSWLTFIPFRHSRASLPRPRSLSELIQMTRTSLHHTRHTLLNILKTIIRYSISPFLLVTVPSILRLARSLVT
jgi:hypothetical protein